MRRREPVPVNAPHETLYVFVWGNNRRRAPLKGRRCVVEARGAMSTVLVRFLDTGERMTTSRRALRRIAGGTPIVTVNPAAAGITVTSSNR